MPRIMIVFLFGIVSSFILETGGFFLNILLENNEWFYTIERILNLFSYEI